MINMGSSLVFPDRWGPDGPDALGDVPEPRDERRRVLARPAPSGYGLVQPVAGADETDPFDVRPAETPVSQPDDAAHTGAASSPAAPLAHREQPSDHERRAHRRSREERDELAAVAALRPRSGQVHVLPSRPHNDDAPAAATASAS